jgi:transketolase
MDKVQEWNELAAQYAVDSIRSSTAAGSGHPTSSMSAAHLLAVLWSDHLRYDVDDPKNRANDRFVLSKGHASPLLFSVLKSVGAITDEELLSFRRFGSPVQGHPVPLPDMPWIDVATGSLGQGLPIGLGMALAMKLDGSPARTWVLLGDSEAAEGSVWEAMANAWFHGLSNLVAILDMNRLGQRGPTMLQWNGEAYADRARAFGWNAVEIDGHDVSEIDHAYRRAEEGGRPTMIIAKTEKGHGVSFLADAEGWHGKALDEDQARTVVTSRPRAQARRAARVHRGHRDAQGVRRGVARACGGARRHRRPRRRGLELHIHRGRARRRARAVRRDVHRRAGDARRVRRDAGPGQDTFRRDVRRVRDARVRLHPDGRDQPGEHPPVRLARRRVDR